MFTQGMKSETTSVISCKVETLPTGDNKSLSHETVTIRTPLCFTWLDTQDKSLTGEHHTELNEWFAYNIIFLCIHQ